MRRLRNRLILLVLAVAAVLALRFVPASSASIYPDFQPQCHFQASCPSPSTDQTTGVNGLGGGSYQP